MARYSIVLARSARKELEQLDETLVRRVLSRIDKLADDPRPRGVRKISGSTPLWRLRVGAYRIVFAIHDDTDVVDIIAIRHRSDAYR